MLQRLVNVSQQQGKLYNDCFVLCSEASKQKAFHNKSLGDENRKQLKSWQPSMADVPVLEFVPSQWPLRQMKWTAASSRWTLSVKADCWAPMATPRDDVETALEYSFEDNASKKKLWRKKALKEKALRRRRRLWVRGFEGKGFGESASRRRLWGESFEDILWLSLIHIWRCRRRG